MWFNLNRKHLLAEPLIAIVTARETLLTRIRDTIDWELPCVHASLFGSLARGEAGSESDIDVLVARASHVSDTEPMWQEKLVNLEEAVLRWADNPLAWFETTEADLERANRDGEEPVVDSWRSDAVLLAGIPLSRLLDRVNRRLSHVQPAAV